MMSSHNYIFLTINPAPIGPLWRSYTDRVVVIGIPSESREGEGEFAVTRAKECQADIPVVSPNVPPLLLMYLQI